MDTSVEGEDKVSIEKLGTDDSKAQLSMETKHEEEEKTASGGLKNRIFTEEFEKRLLKWVNATEKAGYPVVTPLLREKAIKLNHELGGHPLFKASKKWINGFKKRHNIGQRVIQDENNQSVNCEAAKQFVTDFQAYITTNKYDIENIYNADETLIRWGSIPRHISKREYTRSEKDIQKSHLAVLVCANAAGTHSVPLLVVGKRAKPPSMKKVLYSLPVKYTSHKSGWITSTIFMDWFKEHFIPLVKQRQEENKSKGKVLLILDDAPSHPNVDELNKIDDHVGVMYLPRNVAAVIQPMNQGIIKTMKYVYRKNVLQGILNTERARLSPHKYLKSFDLKTFCCMVADAFASLSPQTLRNGWKKLLSIEATCTSDNENLLVEIKEIFYRIPAFAEYPEESLQHWLHQVDFDAGFNYSELLDFVSTLEI